jgi:hypothetical protein
MRNVINALVIVVIVLTGGAIAVVAISRVRGAAARIHCANNLKQMGLSICNYGDTYERLPQAAIPNPDLPTEKRLSWVVDVVPFVESNNLYSKMDKKKGWDAEENRFAALMRLAYLQCPGYPERPPVCTLAPSHYLGICGIGTDAISLPQGHPRAGFFGYERKLTLKDIEGCAGMLMMVAETAEASGAWTAAGAPTARGVEPSGPSGGHFGGNHRRGVSVVFADASVRFVADSIQQEVWEASARINGPDTAWDE